MNNVGTFSVSEIDGLHTEEPTGIFRWRRNLIFGRTLQQEWAKTNILTGSVFTFWKEVPTVKWGG